MITTRRRKRREHAEKTEQEPTEMQELEPSRLDGVFAGNDLKRMSLTSQLKRNIFDQVSI